MLIRDAVEAVNVEETTAAAEDEKKPEDAPQPEVEKDMEGVENEEEEKEPEDRVYFLVCTMLFPLPHDTFAMCLGLVWLDRAVQGYVSTLNMPAPTVSWF